MKKFYQNLQTATKPVLRALVSILHRPFQITRSNASQLMKSSKHERKNNCRLLSCVGLYVEHFKVKSQQTKSSNVFLSHDQGCIA